MKATNAQMEQMGIVLTELMERDDKIGYVAAVNMRNIREAITEYMDAKLRLMRERGHKTPDGGMIIDESTPECVEAVRHINELAGIEQDVNIISLDISEVVGKLKGSQIMALESMITNVWDYNPE